jgi:hypothetical protein
MRNERWNGLFRGKVHHQLFDRTADIQQPLCTFGGLCAVVQRISRMSRHYPKGIPKSSIGPVVPHTSVVLFIERTSGGPLRTSALQTATYVHQT